MAEISFSRSSSPDLESLMNCVFSWGSGAARIVCGRNFICKSEEFTERVAALLHETLFSSSEPLPSHLHVPWLRKKKSLSPRPPGEPHRGAVGRNLFASSCC